MGLRDLKEWNKACILQHVRSILVEEGSLWIAWIREYVLKGRSYWDASPSSSSSWNWGRLIKLKEIDSSAIQSYPLGSMVPTFKLWEVIRIQGNKVCWHKLVWFPLHIPKHAIINWMAVLNWLPTRDRLLSFGLNIGVRCLFCCNVAEPRTQILFECDYPRKI